MRLLDLIEGSAKRRAKKLTDNVGSNDGEVNNDDEKEWAGPIHGDEEGNAGWDWTDPYHSSGEENAVNSKTP